jgi:hypothetical protein
VSIATPTVAGELAFVIVRYLGSFWHIADIPSFAVNVRFRAQSGRGRSRPSAPPQLKKSSKATVYDADHSAAAVHWRVSKRGSRRFLNARSTLRCATLNRPHLSALVVKVCSTLDIILRAWHCTLG